PLLHTWSLGLEEQFYLVWPLALVLLLPRSRAMAFVVLGGLAVASLAAAEIIVRQHPAAAFFLLPFRAFEFIVGGLIAAGAIRVPAITRHRAVSIVLALAAMAGSMAIMDGGDPMPGLLSLVPVIGAALLILSCQERPLAPFPGLPVVRHLAQVSYSLYLVHW
ncbi:MAG: acyltransferase, partial [Rhodobiaceae bacterium]|nr:acyltransferase [Rhodobiaceae bacterium]